MAIDIKRLINNRYSGDFMIKNGSLEKVYYPKMEVKDLVLSLEYKYSECHSDNESYYYKSKYAFSKEKPYDYYFEARNKETKKIEACILCSFISLKDILIFENDKTLMIDKLSFNRTDSLIKLLYYVQSVMDINNKLSSLSMIDVDASLKDMFNDTISFYDFHNKYSQRDFYKSEDVYKLKLYNVRVIGVFNYEDSRNIFLDNHFTLSNNLYTDDTFLIEEGKVSWAIPAYNHCDENDGDLVYFNEELPIGLVPFNRVYYDNQIIGYFVFDMGVDFINNDYVAVAYIYDMYIDSRDEFKYNVLEYILNYIKYYSFKFLCMYFVLYKLNDGKDTLCNCLVKKYNAIDDGDKIFIKYIQK